jgi:hypothetical protein
MPPTALPNKTAVDALHDLRALHAEHALLVAADDASATELHELQEEIAAFAQAYVGLAVTEIASLRASVDGPLVG